MLVKYVDHAFMALSWFCQYLQEMAFAMDIEGVDHGRSSSVGRAFDSRTGGSIPRAAPRGGGYIHTLPIRVCAAQQGRDFKAPDLERGVHFRGIF